MVGGDSLVRSKLLLITSLVASVCTAQQVEIDSETYILATGKLKKTNSLKIFGKALNILFCLAKQTFQKK